MCITDGCKEGATVVPPNANNCFSHSSVTRTRLRLRSAGAIGERIAEQDIEKVGDKFVLKQDTSVTVHARAFKMSKSRGNVVNPDDVVLSYGADSLRLYEMFMGPLRDTKVWSTKSVEGVHRFLARVWRLFENGVFLPETKQSSRAKEQLSSSTITLAVR